MNEFLITIFAVVVLIITAAFLFIIMWLIKQNNISNQVWSNNYQELNVAWARYVTELDKKWGEEVQAILAEAELSEDEEGVAN